MLLMDASGASGIGCEKTVERRQRRAAAGEKLGAANKSRAKRVHKEQLKGPSGQKISENVASGGRGKQIDRRQGGRFDVSFKSVAAAAVRLRCGVSSTWTRRSVEVR